MLMEEKIKMYSYEWQTEEKILEDKSEEKAHTIFISLQNSNDLQMFG